MTAVLKVSEYDPTWPVLFEEEKVSIQGVMGEYVSAIEHVGSTAVPGLGDFSDECGCIQGENLLLFRDYLRQHPEVAQDYFQLKMSLVAKFGSDRSSYTDGKTDFVLSVLEKAHQGHIQIPYR